MVKNPMKALFGGGGSRTTTGYYSPHTQELDQLMFDRYKQMLTQDPSAQPQPTATNVLGYTPRTMGGSMAPPDLQATQVPAGLFQEKQRIIQSGAEDARSRSTAAMQDRLRYKGMGRSGVGEFLTAQSERDSRADVADAMRDLGVAKMGMEFDEASDINRLRAQMAMQGKELDLRKFGLESEERGRGLDAAMKMRSLYGDEDIRKLALINQYFQSGMMKPTSSSSQQGGIIPGLAAMGMKFGGK